MTSGSPYTSIDRTENSFPEEANCTITSDERTTRTLLDRISQLDQRLSLHKTWLQIALRQTNDVFWEYDIATKCLTAFFFDETSGVRARRYEDFPEGAIKKGYIHADSIPVIRKYFDGIHDGVQEAHESLLLNDNRTGSFVWATLFYRMQSHADGTPLRAIGVREDMPMRLSSRMANGSHEPVPENIYPHLFCYAQAALDSQSVDYLIFQGIEHGGPLGKLGYDELVNKAASMLFDPEEEPLLRRQCDADQLIDRYRRGIRWTAQRYHMVDSDGVIRHLLLGVNVRKSLKTGRLVALFYLLNMEMRARWEAKSSTTLYRDPVTRLYTLDAVRDLACAIVPESAPSARCAVTMLRLEGLSRLNARNRTCAQRLRQDVSMALAVFLDPDCIICENEEDGIVALIPEVGTDADVQRRLDTTLTAVRVSLEDALGMEDVHIVAGTSCCTTRMFDFDLALSQADMLCSSHRGSEHDVAEIAPNANRTTIDSNDGNVRTEYFSPFFAVQELDEDAAHAFTHALESMLHADTPGAGIRNALGCLGSFYQADRAYIMSIAEDSQQLVSVLFEWLRSDHSSIQRSFSNQPVNRFPLIKRYAKEQTPVLVSRPASMPLSSRTELGTTWRFAIVPIAQTNAYSMILCVENPHANLSRWSVAERVMPFVHHNWSLLANLPAGQRLADDAISRLPDKDGFERACSALRSDRCTSLGVLALDLANVENVVALQGISHVIDTVCQVERTLSRVFGADLLFHTADKEFMVLCANTTYDSFLKRCARVRASLLHDCPGEFRIGSTWSSDAYQVERLASEARLIMSRDDGCAPVGDANVETACHENAERPTGSRSIKVLAEKNRFDVYLQPKIDMRTGALMGAEALARTFDDHGRAVVPSEAIKDMEHDGRIRDLDYFVFNRALSLMSGWHDRGLGMVPLSSNFSRSTLLTPSALASVLAIMSHYPDIPPEMMEMEITETACNLGKATFSRIVNAFRETGLRVALDDFGSSYSNASVLAKIDFDAVKIDRSLVNDVANNEVSRMLVKSIVAICKSRRMDCIAEGIETEAQASALVKEGCFFCQGFYYDKPMPVCAFEEKYLLGKRP